MKSKDPPDPTPDKRVYYRHRDTGQLAYLVERGGGTRIKLDRGGPEIVRAFHPQEWNPERELRPLTRAQVAQVAFEADRRTCFFLGLHEDARREWHDLRDEERIRYVDQGPSSPELRRKVYAHVMQAFEGTF